MTNGPGDFSNPKVPQNMREFFILYSNDSEKLNAKLDEMEASYQEDREDFLSVIGGFKLEQVKQDEHLNAHIKDYNNVVAPALVRVGTFIKIVTWVGTTLGAGVLVLILGILTGQVILVKP